ncbi:hypothetical protein CTI12_AA189180 [Artemisia annua]|uniref:Uncharacterized protein n=1 Tax=Artemisia annua TaxID=35608 RepID=A0A2U1P616_ARTAN|nr:hypothetical protein CTI12_AA189180 [Artemisia annua]
MIDKDVCSPADKIQLRKLKELLKVVKDGNPIGAQDDINEGRLSLENEKLLKIAKEVLTVEDSLGALESINEDDISPVDKIQLRAAKEALREFYKEGNPYEH